MTDEDDEIVQAFLVESAEGLDDLDRSLVELERHPDSRELLSAIFRTVHTIKGTSGFLAFGRLESLTHVGENLLSRLRDGDLVMTASSADALLAMVDAIRAYLDCIANTGSDADAAVDDAAVIARLQACNEETGHHEDTGHNEGTGRDDADTLVPPVEVPPVEADRVVAAVVEAPVREAPTAATPTAVPAPAAVHAPPASPVPTEPVVAAADTTRAAVDASVRVDVGLLDTLVQLVGELVLTRNQILQQVGATTDAELVHASQRLNIVASELQEGVMRTRMQPIGQAWTKFPRVVRDLGAQLGKEVRLEMSGQETELDRNLLEAVKDPLTHLVRNAIDHGIELPQDRVAAGKPASGTLSLRASHESGQVVVEISDDGKGLDPARIGQVALQRGVVTEDQLARMSDREVSDLIFRPGFSTAAAVTNVSGRGVGMDVVRTNIERIGGVVDLTSTPGLGTTIRVRIPLTLAIIPALLVAQAGECYCIPQVNLVELVMLGPEEAARDITMLGESPIMRLRGQLLPLVSLSSVLGDPAGDPTGDPAGGEPNVTVVVVQANGVRFGLVVDEVYDTQEIVVKPLGRQLRSIAIYAGATIMGDGRVSLILDINGVAQTRAVADSGIAAEEVDESTGTSATNLLVLDIGGGRRAAMSLDKVSRLEEFPAAMIERSGSTEVIQYRDGILPLVRLARLVGGPPSHDDPVAELVSVVVHDDGGKRVGIVADRVVDVVDTAVSASEVGRRPGVLGTAVVQGRITDLVDLDAVVDSVAAA